METPQDPSPTNELTFDQWRCRNFPVTPEAIAEQERMDHRQTFPQVGDQYTIEGDPTVRTVEEVYVHESGRPSLPDPHPSPIAQGMPHNEIMRRAVEHWCAEHGYTDPHVADAVDRGRHCKRWYAFPPNAVMAVVLEFAPPVEDGGQSLEEERRETVRLCVEAIRAQWTMPQLIDVDYHARRLQARRLQEP